MGVRDHQGTGKSGKWEHQATPQRMRIKELISV